VLTYWRSLLKTGGPGETEPRLRRFDGTFRWFLIRAVPLSDEGGQPIRVRVRDCQTEVNSG
jgi:PAS domain-containing protein